MSDLLPTFRSSLATAATVQARRRRRRRSVAPIAGAVAVALVAVALVGWPSSQIDVAEKAGAALTAGPDQILHLRALRTTEASHRTTEVVEQWEESDPLRGRIWVRPTEAPVEGTQFAYDADYYERDGARDATGARSAGADPVAGIRRLLEDGRLADAGDVVVDGRTLRRFRGTIDDAHVQQQLVYDVDAASYRPVVTRIALTPRVKGALQPAETMTITTRYQVVEELPANADNERLLRVDDGARTPPRAEP